MIGHLRRQKVTFRPVLSPAPRGDAANAILSAGFGITTSAASSAWLEGSFCAKS